MSVDEVIARCVQNAALPFLVIGGNAVITHGYARFTYDLDFLVRRTQGDAWCAQLAALGYTPLRREQTFIQFTGSEGAVALDLMLVTDETFDRMFAEAGLVQFGAAEARVASLDHLLALKLHVLKQGQPHRVLKDMDDVIMLVLKNGLDLRSAKYRDWFLKYGDEELYGKLLRATAPDGGG